MSARDELIAGLREAANFLEQHQDVPTPVCGCQLDAFVTSRETLRAVSRVASTWKKKYLDHWFVLSREFRGGVAVHINANRSVVCRRVVVGSHVEPERVIEDVRWECDEPLLTDAVTP